MLSSIASNHIARPHNIGPLEGASCYGVSGVPGDGPSLEIWLRLEGDVIKDAAYRTHGCPSSIACGSMLCDLARGRTVEQVLLIEPSFLDKVLGGLPEGKGHFANMAIEALRSCLSETGDNI